MDFLWFRSGLALSKRFLCSSPAGHKCHEHTGKNYHQQANNNPRKLPDSALCSAFFHHSSSHWSRRGVWRDDLCILPTSPGTKRTMFKSNPVLTSYLNRDTGDTASMAVEPRLSLGRGSNNRDGLRRPGKRPSRCRRRTSQGRTGSPL